MDLPPERYGIADRLAFRLALWNLNESFPPGGRPRHSTPSHHGQDSQVPRAHPGHAYAGDLDGIMQEIGITEVLINLHAHADVVRTSCKSALRAMCASRVVEEQQLLGSAGTLQANRKWVEGDDLFWVFYADVLHCADLPAMLRLHRQRGLAATLGVYEVADPSRCGIVTANSKGVIEDFVEKPAHPTSNMAFSGLMIGTPEVLDVIPDSIPVDIGFHVLPKLTGKMVAFPIRGLSDRHWYFGELPEGTSLVARPINCFAAKD